MAQPNETSNPQSMRETNRQRLREAAAAKRLSLTGGVHRDTMGLLLLDLHYDVTPSRVRELIELGLLPGPERIRDPDFQWHEDAILDVAAAFEAMGLWLPFSGLHDHKKPAAEIQAERDTHREQVAQFNGFKRLSYLNLLLMVRDEGSRVKRGQLVAALVSKVQDEHGIELLTPAV